MRAGRESGLRDRRSAGPGGGPYSPSSSLGSVRSSSRRVEHSSSPNHQHSYQIHPVGGNSSMVPPTQMTGSVGSNMSSGGGNTGGMSTNTAYLSPPLDSSWRRTHSDSALHQAALASGETILIGNTTQNMARTRGEQWTCRTIASVNELQNVYFFVCAHVAKTGTTTLAARIPATGLAF